ncbi:MarR family transcriptional regulator [Enterococcus hirae]|uniref:MarR family transcriptional regulator n=1 Tax=Enterococcus hirae TaxID=1354 RepID=UPI001E52CEBB|nr:MarR family transcriptional regulator [Enterococcus hirae]MCD5234418.1 MarR family transcriptional regulator [Enterococcus hirae]
MDSRLKLISEMVDLTNEITWRNKPKLEQVLEDYSLNEIDLIEKVASIPNPNVTKLANASYMTRGAISKLTKKMITNGLLESYQKPENKKERYFLLTAEGQRINKMHQKLHEEFLKENEVVFQQMTKEEFDTVFRFIGRFRENLKRTKLEK